MAAQLKYSAGWYMPASLRSGSISAADIKKEYTRLRDIAQKRLKRMAETPYRETATFQRNIGNFPKIADMKNKGVKDGQVTPELAYKLAELARFVSASTSTVTGMKKQQAAAIKTLHSHGYTFVNDSNYIQFGKFMEEWREQHLDWTYDSGDAVDLYGQVERFKMDPEKVAADFQYWLDNRAELEKLKPGKSSSVKVIARRIEAQMKREKEKKSGKRKSKKRSKK